jgi:hypothetical protein
MWLSHGGERYVAPLASDIAPALSGRGTRWKDAWREAD